MAEISRNVALSVDAIDEATLFALLNEFTDRIGYLVSDVPSKLRNLEREGYVRRATNTFELGLVLDTQLSGGFHAMEERAREFERLFHPSHITVGGLITIEGLKRVVRATKDSTRILVTGMLPDISISDLATSGIRSNDPRDLTEQRARLAKEAQAAGVYGAAHEANDLDWSKENLAYFASGISPDGQPYGDKKLENVTKLSAAFALGATVAVVGSAIYDERFGANDPEAVSERVQIVRDMLS